MTQFTSWNMRVCGVPSRRIATAVCVGLATMAVWFSLHTAAANAAPPARHGLLGLYYATELPIEKDFLLPVPVRNPDATRVDAQIAFGQGQGFKIESSGSNDALMGQWARFGPLQGAEHRLGWLKAVVWRGYIHFPKAGTYYFSTVSHGSSAVYLNDARVTLNGPAAYYGAMVSSDAFSYDQADIADFIEHVRHTPFSSGTPFSKRVEDSYVMPVTVEAARDLPIEVRYASAITGDIGIDLFWVTPDSPKDSSGKPLAKLVPADALYAEAPRPVEQPVVRSANSTLALDLYCAGVKETQPLIITFRLADSKGQPVAGKRVLFTTTADHGFDQLTQPENPTDQNGITTAKLRSDPTASAHNSSIYAIDATDLVAIGQVGHVRFPEVKDNFFASPCVGGFDPREVAVDPQPMVAGRPHTVSVKLQNRQSTEVELGAIFEATNWNIGATSWSEIGRVQNIRLKPGEVRDVSVRWTPSREQVHQCFRVRLRRRNQNAGIGRPSVTVATALVPSVAAAFFADDAGTSDAGSVSHNYGPIIPIPPNPCMDMYDDKYPPEDWIPAPPGADWGSFPDPTHMDERAKVTREAANRATDPKKKRELQDMADCFAWGSVTGSSWSWDDSGQAKVNARALSHDNRADGDTARRAIGNCPPGNADCIADELNRQLADAQNADYYDSLAKDPPASVYRGLAVAKTDTTTGYIDAIRVSLERYKGARDNGDREWMNRHLTALQLYSKKLADALSQQGDEMQKRAEALPPDDAVKLKAARDSVVAALRRGEPLPAEQTGALRQSGMSDEQVKKLQADILAHAGDPIEGPRGGLLRAAQHFRGQAATWRDMSGSASGGTVSAHPPRALTFTLSNPHGNREDVHLYIQPMSLPSSWQLSIVNAEMLGAGQRAAGDGEAPPQPEFPIYEVNPGREYVVSLPPGKEIKIASRVVPQGELGAGTTARWAVEGHIGNEVIGSMVSELSVPAVVPGMKLPPVGSAEVFEEPAVAAPPPATTKSPSSHLIAIAAAAAAAVIAILFVLIRRRKRQAPGA